MRKKDLDFISALYELRLRAVKCCGVEGTEEEWQHIRELGDYLSCDTALSLMAKAYREKDGKV